MKYVSIDIETTGLNPETCQIVEIAAIIDDLSMPLPVKNLPKFHCYVSHELYQGEPYALAMHQEKFYRIAKPKDNPEFQFIKNDYVAANIAEWLIKNGFGKDRGGRVKAIAAGKNFAGFDLQFLKKLPKFEHNLVIPNRVIDVGPMYMTYKDKVIPDLDECAKRAGLSDTMEVTHDGMNEALMVVELIRKKLLPQEEGK